MRDMLNEEAPRGDVEGPLAPLGGKPFLKGTCREDGESLGQAMTLLMFPVACSELLQTA